MLVTRNVVTKEEVIAATRKLAAKLGRPPRYAEVIRVVNVTRRQIQRMFGGWAAVLEESGCERIRIGGGELTLHELWQDWVTVARQAGRRPTIRQYEKFSRYSMRPLKDRFGTWDRIPAAILAYGDSKALWAGWEDVREMVEDCTGGQMFNFTAEARRHGEKQDQVMPGLKPCYRRSPESHGIQPQPANNGPSGDPGIAVSAVIGKTTPATEAQRKGEKQDQERPVHSSPLASIYPQQPRVLTTPLPEGLDESLLYGEPLSLAPMATAPTNEAGVMFLFATLALELGFVVLKVQKGFPDCEAFRRLPNGKWQRLRIEFEFASRNFVLHGHDVKGCELIVCWEHNWSECPIEVVELSKLFTADSRG